MSALGRVRDVNLTRLQQQRRRQATILRVGGLAESGSDLQIPNEQLLPNLFSVLTLAHFVYLLFTKSKACRPTVKPALTISCFNADNVVKPVKLGIEAAVFRQ